MKLINETKMNEGAIKLPQVLIDASYQIVDAIEENLSSYINDESILKMLNVIFDSLFKHNILYKIKQLVKTNKSDTISYIMDYIYIFLSKKIELENKDTTIGYTLSRFGEIKHKEQPISRLVIQKDVLELSYYTNLVAIEFSDDVIDYLDNNKIKDTNFFKPNMIRVFYPSGISDIINETIMSDISKNFGVDILFDLSSQDNSFRGQISWYKQEGVSKSTLRVSYINLKDLKEKLNKRVKRQDLINTIQHEFIHYVDYINSHPKDETFNITNTVQRRQQWIVDDTNDKVKQIGKKVIDAVIYYTSDHEMQTFSNNFANAIVQYYFNKKGITPDKIIRLIEKVTRNFTKELQIISSKSSASLLLDGIETYFFIKDLKNFNIPVYNRNDYLRDGTKTIKNKVIQGDKIWIKLRGYIVERLNDMIKSLKSDDSNNLFNKLNEGVIKLPQVLQDASYKIVDMIGDKIILPLSDKAILQQLNDEFNSSLQQWILHSVKSAVEKQDTIREKASSMDDIFVKHKIQNYGFLPNMDIVILHIKNKTVNKVSSHIVIKKDVLEIDYSTINEIRVYYSDDVIDLLDNYKIPFVELFKTNTLKVFDPLRLESEVNINIMFNISNQFDVPIKFKLAKINKMGDDDFRGRIGWYISDGESKSSLEVGYYDLDDLLNKFTNLSRRNEIIQTIQHELIHYYDYINSQKGKTFDVINVIYERQQWVLDAGRVTNSQSLSNMKTVLYYTSEQEMQSFSNNFSNAIVNHYIKVKIPSREELINIIDKLNRNFTMEMKKLNRISTNPDLTDVIETYLTISKLSNYKIPVYNRNDYLRDGTKTRKNKIIHGDKIWMKLRGYIVERLNDMIKSLKSDDSIIQRFTKIDQKPKYHDGETEITTIELNKKIKESYDSVYNKLVEFLYNATSKFKSHDEFESSIMGKYTDKTFGHIFESNKWIFLVPDYDNKVKTFFDLENIYDDMIYVIVSKQVVKQSYDIIKSDFEVLCGNDIKKISQEIISQS